MEKRFFKLDGPFEVSPSTSFLRLTVNEIEDPERRSQVEFLGWFENSDSRRVVFFFDRLLCGRLGSMSGEGRESPYSISSITNSDWLTEINDNQRTWYPDHAENLSNMRHFVFKGHDSVVEVIAESYEYRTYE